MDKYLVLGNPVAHSLSPHIHTEFAKQTHQNMSYGKLCVPIDELSATIKQLIQQNYQGFNITLPFKQQAFEACDQLTARAQQAHAVNTIKVISNEKLLGDNTDGIGLVNDFKRKNILLSQQKILIIGAGGASRGIIPALLNENPKQITITNRTFEKALLLQEAYPTIKAKEINALRNDFNIIINATSTSINNQLPPVAKEIMLHSIYYDLSYGESVDAVLEKIIAKQKYNGFGMLLEQAAESFYLWRGVYPSL